MDELRNHHGDTDAVNRLYWESDKTVGAIGEELGVNKTALYAAIQPIPSGATCAECGGQTVFTNRTTRASGTASCTSCQDQISQSRVSGPAESRSRPASSLDEEIDEMELGGFARWRDDLRSVSPQRVAMIGGAAALGVMLGAIAVRSVRDAR